MKVKPSKYRRPVAPMGEKRRARQALVDRANKLRDKSYRLKPSQWQRAIFTIRQHGGEV